MKKGNKNTIQMQGAKGFSMIRQIVMGILVLGISAWAVEDSVEAVEESRLDKIEKAVSKVMSKAGINLGGEFRSQFLLSRVKGDAVEKTFRKDENVEYTSVDFDISARPNTALQGRLLLRFHTDWRNFFSSLKSPVFARWLSIDGLVKNVFSYNIGDFRQKYSPLTLYSPDIDIPYEPEIFTQFRRQAMGEVFLGENDRILQGVNMNFDAEIVPLFKEFHFNFLGSRLRLAGVGTESNIADFLEESEMDKYLLATNLEMVIIPDLVVGGSVLDIFDSRHTYHGASEDVATATKQQTLIHSERLGFGTAPFIDPDKFNIAVKGEIASSIDDAFDLDTVMDTSTNMLDTLLDGITTKGTAWTVDLSAHLGVGSAGNLNLTFGYLRNGVYFWNELAQSPTLFRKRIMNSENDLTTDALYSTFDVLYRHVFKFTPSENAWNASDSAWFKGPQSKSAYSNGLLTQEEINAQVFDPALYLVMPFGPATPNRKGIRGTLSGDFIDNAILFSVTGKYLDELVGMRVDTGSRMPETKYYEVGGGLSVDIAGLGDWWPYPFVFSGGYTQSNADNEGLALIPESEYYVMVDFVNVGLFWTFWKRASLLGGFQYLKTTSNVADYLYDQELKEIHWAVGLQYEVSEGGTITSSFGFNDVLHTDEADDVFGATTDASEADFRQWQTDLYLTVNF